MEYPHANVDTHSPELFIRDIEFLNWHINHDKWSWFKYFTMPYAHRLELDFCCFDSDCWTTTTTEKGSGSATETCIDAVNGVLQITNAGADNDLDELVYGCECFQLVDNFELYAEVRLRIDDPDNADWWFGLITGNSFFTPPNDYVVFFGDVATGGDSVYFANAFNGAGNQVDTGIDLPDDTWYRFGFHWDGKGTIRWFVFTDAQEGGYCVATGSVTTYIVQDEELNVGFGIRNAEADAHSLDIDYLYVVQKRVTT